MTDLGQISLRPAPDGLGLLVVVGVAAGLLAFRKKSAFSGEFDVPNVSGVWLRLIPPDRSSLDWEMND